MFDRLDDLLRKFEEIMNELSEPDVANNQERFRALMKEQSNLTPIVNACLESAIRISRTLFPCWRASLTKRCGKC